MFGGKIKRSIIDLTEKKQSFEPQQKNRISIGKIDNFTVEITKNVIPNELVIQLQSERAIIENNLIKCIIPVYDMGSNEYILDTTTELLGKKINMITPYLSKVNNKSDRFAIVEKKMSDAITGEITIMKFVLDKYTNTRSAFTEESVSNAFLEKYMTILDLIATYGNVVINDKPC